MMGPGDYVVRGTTDIASPYVTVTVVDMAGHVAHVTIPKRVTANGEDIDILRAAVNRANIQFNRGDRRV